MIRENHNRLQRIFREVFDNPSLALEPQMSTSTLEDWDSVQTVQLVLAIENEFAIRFRVDEVAGLDSVAKIMDLVDRHING